MPRWTETWLSGLPSTRPQDGWKGRRLGLPPEGVGAVATTGSRLAAFFVDLIVGGAIGGLVNVFVTDPTPLQRTLSGNGAFALQVLVLTALTGQTLGMKLLGLRVARLHDLGAVPGFLPAALRTGLLVLLLPALLFDRDGRGLHDKAAGTVVLRAKTGRSFATEDGF